MFILIFSEIFSVRQNFNPKSKNPLMVVLFRPAPSNSHLFLSNFLVAVPASIGKPNLKQSVGQTKPVTTKLKKI